MDAVVHPVHGAAGVYCTAAVPRDVQESPATASSKETRHPGATETASARFPQDDSYNYARQTAAYDGRRGTFLTVFPAADFY